MELRIFRTLATAAVLGGVLGGGVAACMQGATRQPVALAQAPTVPGFGLYYMDEGGSAKLAYGQANSDNVGLMLQCTKGSRRVQITEAASGVHTPRLTLASAGQSTVLNAQVESGEGVDVLVGKTPSDSAPLRAFRRSGRLEVAYGDQRMGVSANADERAGVERFFAACG